MNPRIRTRKVAGLSVRGAPPRARSLRRTGLLAALFALVLSASLAPPSFAAALSGSPLTVHVGPQGQLQAFRAGNANGIFFRPESLIGDAGFFLAFPSGIGNPASLAGDVYGFNGSAGPGTLDAYTAGTQGPTTGSGTPADPLKQITTYSAGGVGVTQTTTYVNGSQDFLVRWDVRNSSGSAVRFKALAAADFYFEGDDAGTGVFTQGPPRFIGGTNADTGNSGGFEEVVDGGLPPWSTYQALPFPDVWHLIEAAADSATPTFNGSVVGTQVDNAGGIEWDQRLTTPLANNASQSFAMRVRNAVPAALRLEPSNAGSPRGVPINFTALATDTNGTPYAGRTLRYSIVGANRGSGTRILGPNGTATITDPGTVAGGDTVIAFVDFNNDGIRQPVEPQASALGRFVDNIPPSCTVKVSGSRPGGGGAGKPLVITVSCNEPANVRVSTELQVPVRRRARSSEVDAAAKRKIKKIRLKAVTSVVLPGRAAPIKVKLPRSVRRKHAGKKLTAKITVRVNDPSNNVKTVKRTKKIKLRKMKAKKRRTR